MKCIYCNERDANTVDHVPPKNLFLSPRPDLLTVPCCLECNLSFSKDDMYFRDVLSTSNSVLSHPDGEKLMNDKVIPSFSREESKKYFKYFYDQLQPVDVISNGGLYLGKATAVKFDSSRIESTLIRITKGLFFSVRESRLPDSVRIRVVWEDQIKTMDSQMLKNIFAVSPRVFGNNIFSYRCILFEKELNASLWLMIFFEGVAFLTFSIVPGALNSEHRA